MIPKTEPADNMPISTSPLSMDSIVKDLRSLEKSFISSRERGQNQLNIMQANVKSLDLENSKSKTELENMKSKIKLLEEQNSKLKSDLEESDMYKRGLVAEKTHFISNRNKLKKKVKELTMENNWLKTELLIQKSSKLDEITDISEYQIEEILDRKVI